MMDDALRARIFEPYKQVLGTRSMAQYKKRCTLAAYYSLDLLFSPFCNGDAPETDQIPATGSGISSAGVDARHSSRDSKQRRRVPPIPAGGPRDAAGLLFLRRSRLHHCLHGA